MAEQDKPLQFIKGGKIQTGRAAQQVTPPVIAPETEPQEEPLVPSVLPSQAPIWRDANGNLSYNQPDSYNWFSSFVDRRLYAQTGGGAGYWLGGRTPTRIFYEWSIGDFQGSERDQKWIDDTTNDQFVNNWVGTLRSQIGPSEQILKEDYGDTVLEDMVRTSVSSNNLAAKLSFVLDAAESKRRIEAYDTTTSWGGYIGTKSLSAVGNYMAVDPITTATTIASLGTGTLLPAAARSTFIASRLPWLTTPLQASKSFLATHAVGLAKANFAFNAVDGALSGYAFHLGYNKDLGILGNTTLLDENPIDDIAIGGTIGLLGGWMGYYMNLRQISRNAAIESVAQTMGSIPHEFAIDYATRYVTNHGAVLRAMKGVGVDVTSDIYRKLQDPTFLRNAGFRSPEELTELAEIIKVERPNSKELQTLIDSKLINETNDTIDFFNYVGSKFKDLKKSGKVVSKVKEDGSRVLDWEGNRADLLDAIRKGSNTTVGSDQRLKNLGFNDEEIQRFYRLFETRSGMDEFDFHEWLWARNSDNVGLAEDLKLLLKYADDVETNELKAIRKHFPSLVPEPNAAGKKFLVQQHGEGRTVEGVLADISTGQNRVIDDLQYDDVGEFYMPVQKERPNHILENDIDLVGRAEPTDADTAFKMMKREGDVISFSETSKPEMKGIAQRISNRTEALANMTDKEGGAFIFGLSNMTQVNRKFLRLAAVAKGVSERIKELNTRTAGLSPIEVKRELDILRKQMKDVQDEFKAITESIENPGKLSKESVKRLSALVWKEFDKMVTDKLSLKDRFFVKLSQIVDIAKMNLKVLDVKTKEKIYELLGYEIQRASINTDPHAVLINKEIDDIFNRLATQFGEVLDARESKLAQRYYNQSNGFFSLDFIKKAMSDPKLQKVVDGLQEKIKEFRRVLALNGEFENNFTRQGINISDGYPIARLEGFINSTDDTVITAYNKLLKDIDAIKAKMGSDAINPIFAERLDLLVKQRLLKNDLLRTRLKDGILAEQLGLLNTRSLVFNGDSRLIDGAIPFRSRNVVGTLDEPVISTTERTQKSILDDIDNLSDDAIDELDIDIRKQELVETVSHVDKQAADAVKINDRLTQRLQYIVDVPKVENPWKGTKFGRTFSDLDRAFEARQNLEFIAGVLSEIKIQKGFTDVTYTDLLKHTNMELEFAKDGKTFSLINKEDLHLSVRDLSVELLDDAGNINEGKLDELLKSTLAKQNEAEDAVKKLLAGGQISQSQYNNFMSRLGANTGSGGWSFAAANGVVSGLRQMTLGYWGGEGIVKLAEWALKTSMDAQGTTASRLWFNRDYTKNFRGMGAFEQVLMFSNLIDSPHVLKRDFGNIVDMNLFSAQSLRNNNARKANAVIQVYKDLHARHGLTPVDNEAVIQALIHRDPTGVRTNRAALTPVQLELYNAVQTYFNTFARDASDVLGNRTAPQGLANAIDNLVEDAAIQFDKGTVLANRGRIRTLIGDTLRRYASENIPVLRNTNAPLYSGVVRNMGGVNGVDVAIAAATTPMELLTFIGVGLPNNRVTYGLEELINSLSNAEVTALRNADDLADALERVRVNTGTQTRFSTMIDNTIEDYLEQMDRTRMFSSSRAQRHNISVDRFAGIRMTGPLRDLFRNVMTEPEMRQFQIRNVADLVVDYANNSGLNLAMQGQISRELGDVTIFQVLQAARTHLTDVARQAERAGLSNQLKNTERTIDVLEDRMAHALGFQLESNPRQGWLEAAFRQQNGMIRASVGSFWGVQTAIGELAKSITLNAQRNGITDAILDLINAIRTKEDLDDLGYALEQYTQKYALGVDNEAYAGRIQMNRAAPSINATNPITGKPMTPITGVNLSPVAPIRRTFDILSGSQVDPSGAAAAVVAKEPTGLAGRVELGAARVADATVGLTESLANTNSRLGGQQWFMAVGRDMAVRKGKRMVVRNIDRLIRFSDEFATSNFDQITDFNQRLAAFKRLAKKHNLDWDFVVRMNHHGLLDGGDLRLMREAFGMRTRAGNEVVPKARKIAGITMGSGERGPYRLPDLVDALGEISARSRTVNRSDDIVQKLTSFLDEEVNTAMNQASLIGSNPNANIVQRWFFQFSNYARGFQHQTILRGANDSTIAKAVGMLVPIIIGEMVYNNVRRAIEGQAKGEKTIDQSKSELAAKMRQNPELVIYETMSRIPVFGGLQSFLMNSVVNPLAMETKSGRDIRDTLMEKTHSGIYDSVDFGVGVMNERLKTDIQTNDIVSPQPNMNNVYLPTNYPWDFKPYTDTFKFVNELVTDNPYRNEEKEFFDVPTGRVYSMVPGVRTWQFQLGLRLMGYPAQSDNIRARKFSKQ